MSEAQLLNTEELLRLPPQRWLVHKQIVEKDQALIYGAPGSGKSFVALDIALCVSTGKPWLGRFPVQQGHVVYVVGEGAAGMQKRVAAWMKHYNVQRLPHISWHVGPMSVHKDGEIAAFLDVLDESICKDDGPLRDMHGEVVEAGVSLKLVVIDTLSRCFGGRDENGEAMAEFVDKVQEFTRLRGAAVLTVHHTNAAGTRERGHTSLRGAMAAAYETSKTGDKATRVIQYLTMTNDKQKDDEEAPPLYLQPVKVETDLKPVDGEVPKSLVFEWMDPPEKEERGPAQPKVMGAKEMLAVLGVAEEGLTFGEWRLAAGGIPLASFSRRLKKLKADSIVHKLDNGKYVITATTRDLAGEAEEDDE